MRNLHVRFLEGGMVETSSCYSTSNEYGHDWMLKQEKALQNFFSHELGNGHDEYERKIVA